MSVEKPQKGISKEAAMKMAKMWDEAGNGPKSLDFKATGDGGATGSFFSSTAELIALCYYIHIDEKGNEELVMGSKGKPGEEAEIHT